MTSASDGQGGAGHAHGLGAEQGPPPRAASGHRRAFAVGIALNLAYVVGEAAAGVLAGSAALLADAVHNLGDVAGLALAWWAAALAARPGTGRRTYGFGRASILAAFANALLIVLATGALAVEAVRRLLDPGEVTAWLVVAASALGVLVNLASALLLLPDRHHDLNVRAAFWHLLTDAAVSLAVVLSGLAVLATGWAWLDPLAALLVAAVILVGTWSLLRQALDLLLDAAPPAVDVAAVAAFLRRQPGVRDIHDLHVWALSTTRTALTCHVVWDGQEAAPDATQLAAALRDSFPIEHCTLQVETGPGCRQACAEAR